MSESDLLRLVETLVIAAIFLALTLYAWEGGK